MKRIFTLLVVVSLLTTAVGPAVATGATTPTTTATADSLDTINSFDNGPQDYVCGWTQYTGFVYCEYPWE